MQGMSKKLSGLLLVILTYTVSNILMFTINGVCWDDCLIWGADRADYEYFFGLGSCNNVLEYWYQTAILDNLSLPAQLVAFRLIAFFAGLLSSIAVWMLSDKLIANRTSALFTALLFAACSVNRTGIMISCLHYAISNMLVLWGMVAIAYDYYKDNVWLRLAAALIWLVALLLWRSAVLLIPAVIVTLCCFKVKLKEVVPYAFKKYWMVIAACAIYAVSFMTWAHPQTIVAEYTTINAKNLLLSPLTTTMTSLHIFLLYVAALFEAFSFGDSLLSIFPVAMAILVFFAMRKTDRSSVGNERCLLILSVVFMLFGVWPQMLIKDVIYTIDLHTEASRIASLMPLPIAFVLVTATSHCTETLRRVGLSFLLAASVFYSISIYVDYEVGQEKNAVIEQYFKDNPDLAGKKILIKDYAYGLNSFPGSIRPYEYESLSAHAYGNENKVEVFLNPDAEVDCRLSIEYGEVVYGAYKMYAYRFIAPERYDEAVKRLIRIDLQSDGE